VFYRGLDHIAKNGGPGAHLAILRIKPLEIAVDSFAFKQSIKGSDDALVEPQ